MPIFQLVSLGSSLKPPRLPSEDQKEAMWKPRRLNSYENSLHLGLDSAPKRGSNGATRLKDGREARGPRPPSPRRPPRARCGRRPACPLQRAPGMPRGCRRRSPRSRSAPTTSKPPRVLMPRTSFTSVSEGNHHVFDAKQASNSS